MLIVLHERILNPIDVKARWATLFHRIAPIGARVYPLPPPAY